ncbi:MAG: T9SS C-terminal target domain-containing protein, partial [Calditrichaeota bacterium]
NEPYSIPADNDPGFYNLASASHWAVLNMVSTLPSGIKFDGNGDLRPAHFLLEQNYPNPFNPNTTIRFEVQQQTDVTLQVFNTLGKHVATLVANKPFAAGRYSVAWDASDLASGIYLYRLEAGGQVETKRMILLK